MADKDWDDNFPDGVFVVPRNPDEASKQNKPGTRPRIIWKRPRIVAPMPTPSPYEERVQRESKRFVRLYGRRRGLQR